MTQTSKHKKIFSAAILVFTLFACKTLAPDLSPTESVEKDETAPTRPVVSPAAPTAAIGAHAFPLASIGDPYAPELGNSGYDVQDYNIQINLDPAAGFQVEAVVSLTALAAHPSLKEFSLDFIGYEIDRLSVNGSPAKYRRDGAKLIITFPTPPNDGDPFTAEISYHGEAERQPSRFVPFIPSLGLLYPDGKTIFIASEPDGARYWFPNNDHPRDKAQFRFEVTVPPGMTAAANGTQVDHQTLESGEGFFVFEHAYPMATYLATIAVGAYQRIDTRSPAGIALRDYVLPEYMADAEEAFSVTGEALDWMSELFGPYPFETYGHVVVMETGFALETQTLTSMAYTMLRENVVIHELAHMWFGDWVSLDSWGEMWRNEGFATYLEVMWEYRDDPDGFEEETERMRISIENSPQLEPLNALSPGNLFGYESYVKGAVVVHALRMEIGDDAFFEGLKLYFQRFGGGAASDADFQAVMEEAGGKDLDAFFTKWLGG